jgi:hypothetical protein
MRRTLELKRVDLGSLFKVAFLLYAVLGLVAGLTAALVFMMMGSLGSLLSEEGIPGFGMVTGVAGMVLVPVLSMMYGIMGSIVVTIVGLLYNLAAGRVGGMKLEFDVKDATPPLTVSNATVPPSHI